MVTRVFSKQVLAVAIVVLFVVMGVGALGHPKTAQAASTFIVTSTLDTSDLTPGDNICDDGAGNCTLRAAIEEANANANPSEQDTINFGLSGPADFTNASLNGYTFTPGSPYPDIVESVVIDGFTQFGAQANTNNIDSSLNSILLIQVSGGPSLGGLLVAAGPNIIIKGLVMNGITQPLSGAVIVTNDATNTQIFGNYLGTDPAGLNASPNYAGIVLQGCSGARVGSTNNSDRNLLSGNSAAVVLVNCSGSFIEGNFVGPDATGSVASGLSSTGIGVAILGTSTTNNVIGGPSSSSQNIIAGNATGISSYTTAALGTPTRNAFTGNAIYDNGIGIDLAQDIDNDFWPDTDTGPNTNDAGDADTGANDYLNTPVMLSTVYSPTVGRLYVHFDLDVTGSPSDTYDVEFYANDTNAPGNGKTLLYRQDNVSAGSNKIYYFAPLNSYDPTGKYITATVTQHDASFSNQGLGSTSEFSAPMAVSLGVLDIDISKELINANEVRSGGVADYRITITNNGQAPAYMASGEEGQDAVFYDLPSPGLTFEISPDGGLACQIPSDAEREQFTTNYAMHHTDYGLMYCVFAQTQIILPGQSVSAVARFRVGDIPANGLTNFILLGSSDDDPGWQQVMQVVGPMQQTPGDFLDEYESGVLRGNGNLAVARFIPSSNNLASSGQNTAHALYGALVLCTMAVSFVIRRRQLVRLR